MFFSNLFGRRWSRVQLRVQKRNVGQAMVKEEAKNEKKRCCLECVGQVMVKIVKKRCLGTGGQEIITKSLAK